MQASAQGQTGASRVQDIPGPSPLWFLDPLMPRLSNPSTNMDPVTIELTNRVNKVIALRIPRAYIAEISEPRKIVQTYITLVVYFPDYFPRFMADQAGHKTRGEIINGVELRSKEEIAIDLRVTAPGTVAKSIEWTRSNRVNGGTFKDKFDLYYDVFQPPTRRNRSPARNLDISSLWAVMISSSTSRRTWQHPKC